METFLLEYGYLALFLLSFLASTLVPLGSEWLLGVLLLNDFDALLVVPVATAGNTCGALTTYAIGLWGGSFLVERVLRISPDSQQKAEQRFNRYGSWSLLFSWVPIIGDPLCLVGGVLKTDFWKFTVLVSVGKFIRYALVAKIFLN